MLGQKHQSWAKGLQELCVLTAASCILHGSIGRALQRGRLDPLGTQDWCEEPQQRGCHHSAGEEGPNAEEEKQHLEGSEQQDQALSNARLLSLRSA